MRMLLCNRTWNLDMFDTGEINEDMRPLLAIS